MSVPKRISSGRAHPASPFQGFFSRSHLALVCERETLSARQKRQAVAAHPAAALAAWQAQRRHEKSSGEPFFRFLRLTESSGSLEESAIAIQLRPRRRRVSIIFSHDGRFVGLESQHCFTRARRAAGQLSGRVGRTPL